VISENKKGGPKLFPQTPHMQEHFEPPLSMWK